MRDRIGAWQGTRRHVGFLIGALRPQTIGAGINGDLAIDAEDLALPIGVGRHPIMMIASVSAGQQMFVALLNPAHRVIELKRQRREYDFLGIEPGFWSKSTTHIGRDDSDTTLLEPENFTERDTQRVRRLRRGINHDLIEPVIAIGENAATLHRSSGLSVHPVFAANRDVRGPHGGFEVAALERPLLEQVVAEVFVHKAGASRARSRCSDHRVEWLKMNSDRGGEILSFCTRSRDAGGDRFADIPHFVSRKRGPRRRARANRLRHHPDRLDPWQVGGGEDPASSGGWHRNRAYNGVRVGAAQKYDLVGTAQRNVSDELTAAAQVPVVLLGGTDAPTPWP